MLVRNRLASYLRSLKSAAHSGVAGGCPMKPVSRFLTSVLLLGLLAGPALAQRAEQIEISGFGSFTRYDRAFLLKSQFGGGIRIGYYTSNRIGIELEGGYQSPIHVFGTQTATLSLASASLVLNYPAGKSNEFYILGGYTRLTFGDAAPYSFTDNGLHGAIGDRVFFGQHWALRLEGKAIWSPKTNFPSGTWGGQVTVDDMRRLMFGVLAFPTQKVIEPFAGGGFALMQVLNPVVDCSGSTPNSDCPTLSDAIAAQDRAQDAASKAFFWLSGGVQISYGKLSVFGQYILTSSARGFLLDGTTHSLQGGVRYSLGTSKEGVAERN